MFRLACKVVAVFVVAVLVGPMFLDAGAGEGTRGDLILRVGAQDDMKSRNILAVDDMWSRSVLFPVYTTVAQFAPETEELLPYLLKGIDTDDDGVFEQPEYGVFEKEAGSNMSVVTAYYDFNGVYFHDGVQATLYDLLFSYHLFALDPGQAVFEALQDKGSLEGSNYSTTRWLWVYPVNDAWDQSILVGENETLTFALHFELQASYGGFYRHPLGEMKLLPRHLWEGTGKVCRDSESGSCLVWDEDIHEDFGYALDPVTGNGVPSAHPDAFEFIKAETWTMEDDLVIGTGPFKFQVWYPGVSVRLVRYEGFYADARDRNGSRYMNEPYISGILYRIYKTAQAAVFALQAGEIDVISWGIPPEFANYLLMDPNIEISVSPATEFHYLGYNMRHSPFGYPNSDPTQGDDGYYLRKAFAHLIDRERIVSTLLQDFGFVGDQAVDPSNGVWYNESIPKYEYDLDSARQILDDHYTVGGLALGYGPNGYRNLPTIDDRGFDILCPQADYDPIRASACNMIAADARDVGLYVGGKLLAMGDIVERLSNRDFEMWVLTQTVPLDLVEFFYDAFHSNRGLSGFQNATFDSVVEEARAELDWEKQIRLAKQCSGILADALPYDFMYFRANVEPYRSDKFVNWTLGRAGSIIRESPSIWTIHPPEPRRIRVELSNPSAIQAGRSTWVTATVRRLDDYTPVRDATVEICIDDFFPGTRIGKLTFEGQGGDCVSGSTDINGDLEVTYESPEVWEQTGVYFTATAEAQGLGHASAESLLFVYPGPPSLSVIIDMVEGDILFAGGSVKMVISVRDEQGLLVKGATLMFASSPYGLVFYPSDEIVLDDGTGYVWASVPDHILDDESELEFEVTVIATNGFLFSEALTSIYAVRSEPPPTEPDIAGNWRAWLIGSLLAAIVVCALARYAFRPSNRRKS